MLNGMGMGTNRESRMDTEQAQGHSAGANQSGEKTTQAALAFVIQTERELAPWKKTTPLSTIELNSYISIKFVTRIVGPAFRNTSRLSSLRAQPQQTKSFIEVWVSSETQLGKIMNIIDRNQVAYKNEKLIGQEEVSQRVDFMDGFLQQVVVEYRPTEEKLLIFLIDPGSASKPEPILVVEPFRLTDYVSLESGAAYLGFCQETANLANTCVFENWTFESTTKSN